MFKSNPARFVVLALACVALAACSSAQPPVAYQGVASSSYLKPNAQKDATRVPYRYATEVDWHRYRKLMIDPVTVYTGADNQFGDLPAQDQRTLANYMESTFAQKLGKRFEMTNAPGQDTLRLKLTLTGVETSTAVLSTLSHFDIAGGLYNSVQAVRGGKGSFTGSVTYVVELYDASSNRLLQAYVSKQYPNAMNIGATFGSLGAAKTGIEKGADALAAQLD
jgi:hypothetical protein